MPLFLAAFASSAFGTDLIHVVVAAILLGLAYWLLIQFSLFSPYANTLRIVCLVLFVLVVVFTFLPFL